MECLRDFGNNLQKPVYPHTTSKSSTFSGTCSDSGSHSISISSNSLKHLEHHHNGAIYFELLGFALDSEVGVQS